MRRMDRVGGSGPRRKVGATSEGRGLAFPVARMGRVADEWVSEKKAFKAFT